MWNKVGQFNPFNMLNDEIYHSVLIAGITSWLLHVLGEFDNIVIDIQLSVETRDGRFGSKVDQIGPQIGQIRDFFRSDFSTFGSSSQMY